MARLEKGRPGTVAAINSSMKSVIPLTAVGLVWLLRAAQFHSGVDREESIISDFIAMLFLSAIFWSIVMIVLTASATGWSWLVQGDDHGSPEAVEDDGVRILDAMIARQVAREAYEKRHACPLPVSFNGLRFGETPSETLRQLSGFILLDSADDRLLLQGKVSGEPVRMICGFTPDSRLLHDVCVIAQYPRAHAQEKRKLFEDALNLKYGNPVEIHGAFEAIGLEADDQLTAIQNGELVVGGRWRLSNGQVSCHLAKDFQIIVRYQHDTYSRMAVAEAKVITERKTDALSRSL